MAERDAIRVRMKPSHWGSKTAACSCHKLDTSFNGLACVWHGYDFIVTYVKCECFIQVVWIERIETLVVLRVYL